MRKKHIFFFTLVLVLSTSMLASMNPVFGAQTTYSNQEWLEETTFDTTNSWASAMDGDLTDVDANAGNGMANCTVVGVQDTFSVVADPPTSAKWHNFTNPDFPIYPMGDDGPAGADGQGIDADGCWASHTWDEDGASGELGQTPSVLWKNNVTTPVNMSDYEITSASVSAIVNGTVLQDVDCPGDTASGGSDGTVVGAVYDYVRFYVLVSDIPGVKEYEVAYNKTTWLGLGNTVASPSTMGDTYMISVPEEDLIFYLTSVLGTDSCNFTITLGIFIYCEDDDVDYELDTWTLLRIKSFNLTFTYEKKIDRSTYVAWGQVGDELPDPPANGWLSINLAILEFACRIDQNWTDDSPNSELRILITDHQHSETLKLDIINTTFDLGGFDVTSLVAENENISVSIQVYLADNFVLSSNRTISFDNVTLKITYTMFYESGPGPNYLWLIILLCAIIAGILAAWAAYQFYLRYPKIIRIIRKTRTNIKKGNETSPLDVEKRGALVKDIQQEQIADIKRQLQQYEPVKVTKEKGGI